MNPYRVDGKLALLTGASRGIGLAIAQTLAEAGADAILVARSTDDLEKAAADLRAATGRKIAAESCDLTKPDAIAPWYEEIVRRHGVPNILINAAGMTRRGPAEELSLDDWQAVLTVNLTSVFALSQAFARARFASAAPDKNSSPAKIVNIASLATVAARPTIAPYTSSKGGLGQLTKALAVEWASKGILVNAIGPGYIETALTAPLAANPEFDAWVKTRCPLGRWGTPRDVALPAVFLASPASDFITGQILYVDGGWLAAL